MTRATTLLLALAVLGGGLAAPSAGSPAAGADGRGDREALAIRVGELTVREPVLGVYVLPREEVAIATVQALTGMDVRLHAEAGTIVRTSGGRWRWRAPASPGLYPLALESVPEGPAITLNVFVMVPANRVRGGRLHGYRIGTYPAGRADRPPPRGFVEVTPHNQTALVSPRFRLGQFVSKQGATYPKYVVLDPRLLQKLERIVGGLERRGIRPGTLHVMSGYRTPYRNQLLGNVPLSLHQWGRAADVFVDANGDGVMDDLNGDERVDMADARLLADVVEDLDEVGGGLGIYPATSAHGPFVHVDVRPRHARWGG